MSKVIAAIAVLSLLSIGVQAASPADKAQTGKADKRAAAKKATPPQSRATDKATPILLKKSKPDAAAK